MDSEEQARMRKLEGRLKDQQRAIDGALEALNDSSIPTIRRIHRAEALLEPHSHDEDEE